MSKVTAGWARMSWAEQTTSTHQDHVIAHVIGWTVLGYFIYDESIYLLLDIGFFWRVYLDGEMGLLPYSVMIDELEVANETKDQFKLESEKLLTERACQILKLLTTVGSEYLIHEVTFYTNGEDWKLVMRGEQSDLEIESSLQVRGFSVSRSRE